jgi:hypothetical protein
MHLLGNSEGGDESTFLDGYTVYFACPYSADSQRVTASGLSGQGEPATKLGIQSALRCLSPITEDPSDG